MEDLSFEITDDERRHLKQMMSSPGYIVLRKIWAGYLDAATATAIAQSKVNPLINRDLIAEIWMRIEASERFMRSMDAGVKFELEMLHKPTEPETESITTRRQKFRILGELDVP